MRNKLGALLCIALGGVLIFSGINGSGAGAVGVAPGQCGAISVGVVNPGTCPTGTITLTETTVLTADPTATAPDSWKVTVSSVGDNPCNLPETGTTQDVPNNGGPVSFDNLYIFQDTTTDTYCQYALTETPVAGFTAGFAPAAPYSFVYLQPLRQEKGTGAKPRIQAPSPIAVVLTNTAAAPTSTTPSKTVTTTPTRTVTSSASSSPVTSVSSTTPIACGTDSSGQFRQQRCVNPFPSDSSSPESASTSPALANTGPNRPVRPSLYIGVGLVLLGLVLLVAGRRRPRGEHA